MNRPKEAHALYFAIDMLEAAEQGDLVEGDRPMRFSDEQKMIELSRDSREEGYAEATLLDEMTSDYESPQTLPEKLSDLIKKFRGFISCY